MGFRDKLAVAKRQGRLENSDPGPETGVISTRLSFLVAWETGN